ncbi:MAG: SDR family NAD(P)-dependent oxidoreductase, partial [Deltaproteobacteria bacterium]|nr:SDR family NAD(P)-dependent oxidoreductase [Deltaproteobacteria bacterium]
MAKTILVTGGAGGICSEICRGLAADGLNIVVADFAKDGAEKVAAEINADKGNAIAVQVDVGDPKSVAAMMDKATAKYGQVDYVFCGAGVMDRVPIIEMPEEMWDRLMSINLKGVFLCAQAAARHMIPR